MRYAVVTFFCAALVSPAVTGKAANDNELSLLPAPGLLLVAAPRMRDPRFKQTVVLLVEHSEDGSLGVIINRKTDLTIKQAFPELGSLGADHALFFGGPVGLSRLSYAFAGSNRADGREVIDGVHWGADSSLLGDLLREQDAPSLRVFMGYAGWGPGQLQFELSLQDWQLLAASAKDIFTDDPGNLWHLLNGTRNGVVVQRGRSRLRPSL